METKEVVANKIHDALNEKNDREKALISVIENKTNDRNKLIEIRNCYDNTFTEREMLDDFSNKLGGDFKNIMAELFLTRAEYDADQLDRALTGLSKDPNCVYEILFSRPFPLLRKTEEVYHKITNRRLQNDINKTFKEGIKDALIFTLGNQRQEDPTPDHFTCKSIAEKLIATKPDDWINDKGLMEGFFLTKSPESIVLTSRYYKKLSSNHIRQAINSMSKANNVFFSALLMAAITPSEMYARKIHEAVHGQGTDSNMLERCLVNRYDLDMDQIKKIYYKIFKSTVKADVDNDTSGDYKEICRVLVDYMGKQDK